jgi:DNA-binding Lrp family transcriptional regulator
MRMTEKVLNDLAASGEATTYEIARAVRAHVETTRSALRRLEKDGRVVKAGFDPYTGYRLWRIK